MESINLIQNEKLREKMYNNYVCVNIKTNPINKKIETLTKENISYIISQYSIFPKQIVTFLEIVRNHSKKMKLKKIEKELTRNLGEELGTQSHGISHYDILIKGLKEEFKLNVSNIEASNSTFQFLTSMKNILSKENFFYALGGIYATEMSANPELEIVLNIINKLSQHENSMNLPEGRLKHFFRMHIEVWEPGHEEGLLEAMKDEITNEEEYNQFVKGFENVLDTMDNWWIGLCNELNNKEFYLNI